MQISEITPLILTFNEEKNITATLKQLDWAKQTIVVDSHSTDSTVKLAQSFSNVRVYSHEFYSHANQWNYGLSLVKSLWVLTLDADYFITKDFLNEVKEIPDPSKIYLAPLIFCISGKPLRCSILPPRPVLFKPREASYYDDGHTQRLLYELPEKTLTHPILHIDRKSYKRWIKNQWKYSKLEADKLFEMKYSEARLSNKLRKLPFIPVLIMPFFLLLVRAGYNDGWRGLVYISLRCTAELLIGAHLTYNYLTRRKAKRTP